MHQGKEINFFFSIYEDEFWIEIFCYRLGTEMELIIPPTFVVYNSKTEECGALIEFFFKPDREMPLDKIEGKNIIYV